MCSRVNRQVSDAGGNRRALCAQKGGWIFSDLGDWEASLLSQIQRQQARDQGSDDTNVRETQVKKSNYGVNIPYVRFS